MRDKLVKIKDIDKMARHLRRDIASQQSVTIKELKNFITQNETISLIRQYSKQNKNGDYLINTKILDKIFTEMYNWILGVELCQLASKGMFDVYWDDKQNCMTFIAIENKTKKE